MKNKTLMITLVPALILGAGLPLSANEVTANAQAGMAEVKGDAAKLALKELDAEIDHVDSLIDNAPSEAEKAAAKARLDVLKEIHDRCRRLIWLNPEPRSMWNTGDSEMRHIAAYSHQVEECSTLAHLQRFVSHLVSTTR